MYKLIIENDKLTDTFCTLYISAVINYDKENLKNFSIKCIQIELNHRKYLDHTLNVIKKRVKIINSMFKSLNNFLNDDILKLIYSQAEMSISYKKVQNTFLKNGYYYNFNFDNEFIRKIDDLYDCLNTSIEHRGAVYTLI